MFMSSLPSLMRLRASSFKVNLDVRSWFEAAQDREDDDDPSPVADRVPTLWWVTGLLASIIMCIAILAKMFHMNVGTALLSLILGFVFSFIGVQSSGTTDVNPVSTVAKVCYLFSQGLNTILTNFVGFSTDLWWYWKGYFLGPSRCSNAQLGCWCRRRWFCRSGYRYDW